jgi:hypothetical protein
MQLTETNSLRGGPTKPGSTIRGAVRPLGIPPSLPYPLRFHVAPCPLPPTQYPQPHPSLTAGPKSSSAQHVSDYEQVARRTSQPSRTRGARPLLRVSLAISHFISSAPFPPHIRVVTLARRRIGIRYDTL